MSGVLWTFPHASFISFHYQIVMGLSSPSEIILQEGSEHENRSGGFLDGNVKQCWISVAQGDIVFKLSE